MAGRTRFDRELLCISNRSGLIGTCATASRAAEALLWRSTSRLSEDLHLRCLECLSSALLAPSKYALCSRQDAAASRDYRDSSHSEYCGPGAAQCTGAVVVYHDCVATFSKPSLGNVCTLHMLQLTCLTHHYYEGS